MIDTFSLTGVAKWNTETLEYEPFELPDNCPLTLPYSDESMETEINCASCRKAVKFGRCYTSKTIHSPHGFGYPVCEDCYNKELEAKKAKKENK